VSPAPLSVQSVGFSSCLLPGLVIGQESVDRRRHQQV
jgi:hypothetical protein